MANNIDDGPEHFVTSFRAFPAQGINAIRIHFGTQVGLPSEHNVRVEHRAGIVLSVTNARMLANFLNRMINEAVIGRQVYLPAMVEPWGEGPEGVVAPDGRAVFLEGPGAALKGEKASRPSGEIRVIEGGKAEHHDDEQKSGDEWQGEAVLRTGQEPEPEGDGGHDYDRRGTPGGPSTDPEAG